MSEDFVQKTDHEHAINRVHDRIDNMVASSIRMEESSKRIEKFASDIHSVVYGNGKPGLITQVSNLFQIVKLNKWLIGIVLISIMGIAFFVLRKGI